MTSYESKTIEKIREEYTERSVTKLDELKMLDSRVKKPALIFAYTFGIIGSLVLGLGMCFAMKVIGNLMPLGIVIGAIGIAMVSVNYLIYTKILASRREKYRAEIMAIIDGKA